MKKKRNLTPEYREYLSQRMRGNKFSVGLKRSKETLIRKSKPIIQLTHSGEYIKEHFGATEAMRSTGIPQSNICAVLNGKRLSAGGFKWMFKEDYSLMLQAKIEMNYE